MSRTRKEGEPEENKSSADQKDDSPLARRNSLEAAEGEPDHEEYDEPGAPSSASRSASVSGNDEHEESEEELEEETKDEISENKSDNDEIEDLICPVTHQLFLHPVNLVPMGVTVERDVAEWYKNNNNGYPAPHSTPKVTSFVDNRLAANAVERYLRRNPQAQSQQYVEGTFRFAEADEQVRPPDEAKEDILILRNNDGWNENPEGGRYAQPVQEQGDGLIGLPIAVAIRKNSVAQDKPDQQNPIRGLLFGDSASKKGFADAVVGQAAQGMLSTIGVDFKTLNLPSGKYTIQDMAGQERFRTISMPYFKNANFILLFSTEINLLPSLRRDYGYDIYQIDYDLRSREAALTLNENPFQIDRPQSRVPAAEAKEISERLLPQISSNIRVPAPQPEPKPQARGFFGRLGNLFGAGDDKDDKKEPPGPRNF